MDTMEPKPYSITIELPGLPATVNSMGRAHWRVKAREAQLWRSAVVWAVGRRRPPKPLDRIKVEYVRISSAELDYDGLVSSFKHVQDGLKDAKVIVDDKPRHIVERSYKWQRGKPKEGMIRVTVTEMVSGEASHHEKDSRSG